jgi:hypothetical protein
VCSTPTRPPAHLGLAIANRRSESRAGSREGKFNKPHEDNRAAFQVQRHWHQGLLSLYNHCALYGSQPACCRGSCMDDEWIANNPQKKPVMERAMQAWSFWQHVERAGAGCRAWWTAASYVALRQPSSCTAERFFSVAQGTTKKTQSSLQDENQEIRHLLAFNHRSTVCDDDDLV